MRVGEALRRDLASGDLSWPIRRAAEQFGEAEAVIDGEQRVSYRELRDRVASMSGALEDVSVSQGGRVGFLGVNSLAHLECWFAVPAAGRVLVDLNFRLATAELEFMVNDCGIELLIVDRDRVDVGHLLRRRCPTLRDLVIDGEPRPGEDILAYTQLLQHAPADERERGPDELAGISYTGGTTGTPKGVMLSHRNLLANALHNLVATGHRNEDRWLHVPAMFHVAGTSNVFACTWSGSSQVVLPRFEPKALIEAVRRESITHCSLVPTMLSMLMEELGRESCGGGLPSLRHIQYAASPITPALQRQVLDYFDCEVVQFYGMTEAAPTVTRLSNDAHRAGSTGKNPHARRLASVGTTVVGVETAVLGPDGDHLAPGEVGELCVRGPNVMLGYWNRADATRAALADGWYHTGDGVWIDEEGYIFLVDRFKDMIITGGENVYSIEVEAALAEHPAVFEAAVFGIPDTRWGESVHAVISLAPGALASSDELIEHCRELIAGYKIPRSIEVRREPLPKSGPGKILKRALREPYWRSRTPPAN
jgi:long-chain acyl-CoA synthetase